MQLQESLESGASRAYASAVLGWLSCMWHCLGSIQLCGQKFCEVAFQTAAVFIPTLQSTRENASVLAG